VLGVGYNAANQPTQTQFEYPGTSSTFWEYWGYNQLNQLTTLNNLNSGVNLAYTYSPNQNNGQVTGMTDIALGQTVSYAYDALKRLTTATAVQGSTTAWTQSYTYDGFGNMTSKAGSGATFTNSVDATTNRLAGGNICYDPDGNMVSDLHCDREGTSLSSDPRRGVRRRSGGRSDQDQICHVSDAKNGADVISNRTTPAAKSASRIARTLFRSPASKALKENTLILTAFTIFHVLVSLIGIASGLVVMLGLLTSRRLDSWTAWFLVTTVATSATGFLFPVEHFMPSHAIGILSLIVLGFAILARYKHRLAGAWRKTYVITATIALYFNVFVLVVQMFRRVPFLEALAPTQSEPPFAIAQLAVLVLFIVLGTRAVMKFHDTAQAVS
jgi:YD repeat-containing protein